MSYLQELAEFSQPFRQMRAMTDAQDIYALVFEDRDVSEQERAHALAFIVEELEALAAHLRQVVDGETADAGAAE